MAKQSKVKASVGTTNAGRLVVVGSSLRALQKTLSLFGGSEALEALVQKGDPLARLNTTIDSESFRPELEKALYKEAKGAVLRAGIQY